MNARTPTQQPVNLEHIYGLEGGKMAALEIR
jgi:hypothetical protein